MTPPAAQTPAPIPAQRPQWQTVKTLLPYLWPKDRSDLRVRVVAAMTLLLASKVANLYVPIFYKKAVDALGQPATLAVGLPVAIIAAYGLARVTALTLGELQLSIFAKVGARAIRQIALRTFEHLHQLSLRFHLDRKTGGMTRALERGTAGIETLLRFMLFNIIPTIVEIILVCGIMLHLFSPWFAIVTMVTLVTYIAFTLVVTEWRTKYRRQMNENDSEAKSKAVDSLLNYETVKYFSNEAHEAARYESSLLRYETASVRSQTSMSFLNVGQAAIIATGVTAIMLMAAWGAVHGTMTIGDFVLVNAYLLQLSIPLNFLGFVYREIRQSLIDMEEMFKLMRENAEIADKPGAPALQVAGGSVSFENVSFGYDARRPILQDVSFTVPAGKTVAIVGPSGAGKSTIARLLFRFYEPSGGAIKIDGQDIGAITQNSLRRAIGIVPQDTVLFNDTITYNIGYGDTEAGPEQIEAAAKAARIHDFIMHAPDGYKTMVGERGLKLSGGEKQRVAIARTILKSPPILLFDEATSALDSRTEQAIQQSLKELAQTRTTLVIAHRLSTIVDADEILVLEHGKIAERGRHADLLAQNGVYGEMWQRQQEAAAEAAHIAEDPALQDALKAVVE